MKQKSSISDRLIILLIVAIDFFLVPDPALATQTHGDPEGLVVHQLAHLFFLFSMGILAYWLQERGLTFKSGWRYIQYAAILLMIWNVDAFTVHMLDEYTNIIQIERISNWQVRVASANGNSALEILYYLVKLDHLWCVPALLLLYIGMKQLAGDDSSNSGALLK